MPWRLKEVIPEALKRAGGKERLRRGLVLAAWREVAGKDLARFTEAVALEEGVLVVHVPDPVVAHQLTYTRLALLRRYEERFPGAVREIRFQVGPLEAEGVEAPPPSDPGRLREAGRKALALAALGFLGLGAQPPATDWGAMLSNSQSHVYSGNWWLLYPPGVLIILLVLSFNFIGDGLRDAFEVRLRKR